MKNSKLQKVFYRTFLFTLLTIVLIAGVIAGIVAILNNLFKEDDSQVIDGIEKNMSIIADIRLGTPSIEVIYSADEKDSKIEHIVVAILNTENHNLDYITIPADTQYTLTDDLYGRMAEINPDLPKTIRLSELTKYYEGKEVYEYGQLVIEEILGVQTSYYSKITSTDFEKYFVEEQRSYYSPRKATFKDTLVYSNAFISSYQEVKPETVINFLTDFSNSVATNLSLANRTKYAPDYAQIEADKIYFWHVYGKQSETDTTFAIDLNNTKKLVKKILNNASYTVTQEEYNKSQVRVQTSNSKKLKIQILNGAGIKGLAGKWQTKLKEEGYKVESVSDYKRDDVTHTMIIVKKESLGLDLIKYFKAAKTKVDNVSDTYDIIIVIGSEDKIE